MLCKIDDRQDEQQNTPGICIGKNEWLTHRKTEPDGVSNQG
jgi:hypothetical protein